MVDRTLRSLVDISKAINSVLDIDQLLETIMDSAIASVGIERGILFLRLPDGTLQPRVARNVEKETLADAEEISQCIISEVVGSGKYFLSSNMQNDPDLTSRPSVKAFKIQSVVCVPLVNKNSIIGTLYLDSRKATIVFTPNDIQFLQTFANLAAIAIHNARLFEATKSEASYWKKEASQRNSFDSIIHASDAVTECINRARSVAHTNLSVLIVGESGTGKELFSRALHYTSPRREKKFMPINCSALPEHILEAELFGAKKGAYTGSVGDTKGLFEEADGGTIFLDEIADMQPILQGKLLRVLQEGEIRRVGDAHYRFVDVRVVSATNKDIREEIRTGRFRQDLYYRLCGLEVSIPPLRERTDDVLPLADHFIREFCRENRLRPKTIDPDALRVLQQYPFPGNVRELQNIVRQTLLLSAGGDVISRFELPAGIGGPDDPEGFRGATRAHIIKVLEKVGWNQTKAAELLGLHRTTLQAKMKKLRIERD